MGVLYGDKPICIEAYVVEEDTGAVAGKNMEGRVLEKGMEIWNRFSISPEKKDYFFLIFDSELDCRHAICINRKAFLKTVNEHLHLFRYVLGPTLTAESLLSGLINAKDQFYEVLKDNNVLLGILLGYGM